MLDPVAAAEAMAPAIAARAQEIEELRRLPPDIAQRFTDAQLFRLSIPAAYDGLEVHPSVIVRTVEALSRADGSAGWCLMIGTITGVGAAYLPADEARIIYGPADAVTGGVLAPRGRAVTVDGGARLTGRWQWGSGCQHSTWLQLGALTDDDPPNVRQYYLPVSDVIIHDTWFASGLRGTGSNDLEVQDVFVPASRIISVADPAVYDGPLFRFPVFGLLAVGVAAVALGVARAAMDEVVTLAGAKTATGQSRRLAERPTVQSDVAEAEAALQAARALMFDAIDQAWERAAKGDELTLDDRARLRLAATHATLTCARVVDTAYGIGGGTSVYESSPLQRYFRNVHVVTQHMVVAPATLQLAGRVLLGLPTNVAEL
jgi:alkylation response protein AidB-like acyl-CoA dehydrogenase